MSVSSWNKAVSGNYDNPAKWSAGVPNLPTNEADLLATGKPYTVTAGGIHGIGELDIGADATLAIVTESVFIVSPPYGPVGVINFGAIDIGAGSQMIAGNPMGESDIFNGGSINVAGVGSQFEVDAAVFELNGDGVINLSDGAAIVAFYGPATLDNESNTIAGSGAIGNGDSLTLVNGAQGVIDANSAATLTLDTGTNVIQNAGLIETTGSGGLVIENDLQDDGDLVAAGGGALTIRDEVSGDGAITVERGASLLLDSGGVTFGGTVTITAGGVVRDTAYTGAELVATDIENDGTIRAVASSSLYLGGSISGAGKITVTSHKFEQAILAILPGGASLTGGRLILSDSIDNLVLSDGLATQFANGGTISGAGFIGDGLLRLFNTAAGVVDANDSAELSILSDDTGIGAGSETADENVGIMETTGSGGLMFSGALENSGVLSASGAGTLTLDAALIAAGAGVVQAVGGGSIVLEDDSVIANQSELVISAASMLTTTAGDTGDEVETNVFNHGTIDVAGHSILIVGGIWQNSGALNLLEDSGGAGVLEIRGGGDWRLLGDGTITLNGLGDRIASAGAGTKLDNHSNTIDGFGQLGDLSMTIDNDAGGVIEASGGTLTIKARGSLDNAGSMIATSTGDMVIDASMVNDGWMIANSGGAIDAAGQVLGAGLAAIDGAGTIEFGNVDENNVAFRGRAMGTLIVDHSTPAGHGDAFDGEISGFAAGDAIDLRDFAFNAGQMGVGPSAFGAVDASLVLSNGATVSAAFHLLGTYTSAEFQFAADGHGGTAITLAKPV
jgi:adhesin HecA-like repeat protein